MRDLLRSLALTPFLLAVGCGGGGGGSGAADPNAPPAAGAVLLVLDTASGSEALVQFQVEAAVLERTDGTTTPNLLANPHLVTLADPTGAADGLVLRAAPAGDYAAVHLFLVPHSGATLQPDGTILPATSAVDLAIPITDGLQHSAQTTSWLVVGHNGPPPPLGATAAWTPQLSARADGATVTLDDLRVLLVDAPDLVASSRLVDDAALRIVFPDDCIFTDADDNAITDANRFLDDIDDENVRVRGELQRDGRCLARHARRHGRNDNPRLLGRITALEPTASTFVMHVQAQNPRGGWRLSPLPESIRVEAGNARLRRPNGQTLAFGDLQVQQLVKVKWSSRSSPAGELPRFVATEVEVPGAAVPMQPEWAGSVQAVDPVAGTITVVPRHDDPIVIDGVSVPAVVLSVDADTRLQRRARHGPGVTTITLADIVPGEDRIWWRGTVTGPDTIDATWVRVREE
jgi:hypothetical protein